MTKILLAVLAVVSLLGSSLASQCNDHKRGQRQAWHKLTTGERQAYLAAEVCLMQKAPKLNLKGATSRFEEFQATHQVQTFATHHVGGFLPWHRAFMHAHEEALRKECGYKGWQPYWAEEVDSGNFMGSVVLSASEGFGGNGSATDLCIEDGPFAGYVNHIGPRYDYTEHCIQRNINETESLKASQANIDNCEAKEDFISMWLCLETFPHQAGHGGVGGLTGLMRDPVASPGDPLFYMHHTWIDRLWADWQVKDLPKRLTEMGGNNVLNETAWPTFPKRPEGIPKPTGADGDPGLETTLNHVLNMYGNGVNRTVGEVMDIWNGELCYEYI